MASCGRGHEQDDSRLGEICPKCYVITHEELAASRAEIERLGRETASLKERLTHSILSEKLIAAEAERKKLRDEFAAAALTGILACFADHKNCTTRETRVEKAFEYADEMMKARGR